MKNKFLKEKLENKGPKYTLGEISPEIKEVFSKYVEKEEDWKHKKPKIDYNVAEILCLGKNLKAYASGKKIKEIINPQSGYIIADGVESIVLDETTIGDKKFSSEDAFVYTTDTNSVSGKYAENSAYISKDDLNSILTQFSETKNHKSNSIEDINEIKDAYTKELAYQTIIGMIDEKARKKECD